MIDFWRAIFAQVFYFQSGNYLSLKKIIDEAARFHFEKNSITIQFEIFRALELLGVIDISEHSSQIRWSSNWSLESIEYKSFLNTFREGISTAKDRIQFKFVDGTYNFNASREVFFENKDDESKFIAKLKNSMPAFADVIEHCTASRTWSEYLGDQNVDYFDTDNERWIEVPAYLISEITLIRRKLELGGHELMIVHPQKNSSLLILSHEWAYLVLYKYLNKNMDKFTNGLSLSVKAPLRLPTLFSKLLILDSSAVQLDYGIRFNLQSNEPLKFVNNWLGN